MREILLTRDGDNPFRQSSTRNQLVNTSSQTGWAAPGDRTHISPDSLAGLCLRSSGTHTDLPSSRSRRSRFLYSLRGEGGGCGIRAETEPGWKLWRSQWRMLCLWKSGSTWRTTARGTASSHSLSSLCWQDAYLDLSSGRSTCPHRYEWMDRWKIKKAFYVLHGGKLTRHSRGKKGRVLLIYHTLTLQLEAVM